MIENNDRVEILVDGAILTVSKSLDFTVSGKPRRGIIELAGTVALQTWPATCPKLIFQIAHNGYGERRRTNSRS
jgi:hypothetical protein